MTTKPNCPKCDAEMKLRTRRYDQAKFWGCPNFPRCKGTRRYQENQDCQETKEVNWSEYQLAVFDFVKNGSGNAVVEAVAGSGKTTTILSALNYTDKNAKVAFVAFNKRIATELGNRAPDHVHVSTLHSLGLQNIRNQFGKVKVDNRKFWYILKGQSDRLNTSPNLVAPMDQFTKSEKEVLDENGSVVKHIVSLLKMQVMEPNEQNMDWICDRYGINTNGERTTIYKAAELIFTISIKLNDTIVDFNDMIHSPAIGQVKCEQFDFLFVDEWQDLNKAQAKMVLASTHETSRVVAVGDTAQAIYGFAGADTESIKRLVDDLSAKILPLSICYRCPPNHIELAQQFVPQIEAFDGKENGTVAPLTFSQMMEVAKSGDLVMCRTNAPLVAPAFELIRRGIKAVVLGRDIGAGLESLCKKVAKHNLSATLTDLLYDLGEYRERQMVKLVAAKKMTQAAKLDDQVDTIIALAHNTDTVKGLYSKIDQVFDDREQGVVFSSIHKAKGTEADRTFILRPELMPHPMATHNWELEQENNLQYVALTRSKSEMYFVQGEN